MSVSRTSLKDAKKLCLSFSGCGFLGVYHFGAAKCFLDNGNNVIERTTRVAGASAGSLIAALLAYQPEKLDDGLAILHSIADEVKRLRYGAMTPGFRIDDQLRKILHAFLPEDIGKSNHRELFVSLTRQKGWNNVLISEFTSRNHLIECLLASCYIPMYSRGYASPSPRINDTAYIDGGYTNNLPVFDDIPSIGCSPFSGAAHISPNDPPPFYDFPVHIGKQRILLKEARMALWSKTMTISALQASKFL